MQSNINIICEWYELYSRGAIAAAQSLFADDLQWQIASGFPCGDESPFEGREKTFDFYFPKLGETLSRYFEAWQLLSDELLDCGTRLYQSVAIRDAVKLQVQPLLLHSFTSGSFAMGKSPNSLNTQIHGSSVKQCPVLASKLNLQQHQSATKIATCLNL